MQFLTKRAARAVTFAAAIAVGVVPLATSTAANAAGAPSITPSATDNLTGGQVITVDGANYSPNAQVALIQCSSPTPSQTDPGADCDTSKVVLTTAAADGSFNDVAFTLTSGAVGTSGNFCPSKVAGGKCYLIAANPGNPVEAAEVVLTFAPVISVTPNTNVASGDKLTVAGYGFPASTTAYVTECANPPGADTCNGASNVQPMTDSNGTFSNALVTVTTGPWGNSSKWCSAGAVCLITATTDLTGTKPDQSTAAPFTFAASQQVTTVKTTIYPTAKLRHGAVKVSGAIASKTAGIQGLNLTLFQREKGTTKWHKVASKKSGVNGTFAFKHLKHFKHTEQYKVKHPGQRVGNTRYPRSVSPIVTVK